jgi:putative tryptophan/tyrosine transport system substrate-binding protein
MHFRQWKRREFITLLSGAAAWPIAARAQQPAMPVVGYIDGPSPGPYVAFVATFRHGLKEAGYVEGRNVAIEFRWAEGRSERYAEIAAEFVRLKVDVIITSGIAVPALTQATSVIPIVFAVAVDPLGSGLVASLSRPGGNVTGLSAQQSDLVSKRLELLREVVPGFRQLGIMANVGYPAAVLEMDEVQGTARTFGFEVAKLEIRRPEDIAPAFEALKGRAEALYVCSDPLVNANRIRINTLALVARLPTSYANREYVDAGGLMSYGPNFADLFRRSAELVDKVLRGTKPADIPVEQPTKFELVINLKTAKTLGLDVPATVLARADEVIE